MKYTKFLPTSSFFALIAIVGNHDAVSALLTSSSDIEHETERSLNTAQIGAFVPPIAVHGPEQQRHDKRFLSTTITSDMQDMLDLVNTERTAEGLPTLCYNEKLIAAAQFHSDQMVSLDEFAHTIGSSSMSSRVNDQGYSWNSLAENIAINYSIPGAHNAWMNSSGHKANILRTSVQQFGFGMTTQTTGTWSGATYYTQVFGGTTSEPCVTTTPPTAPTPTAPTPTAPTPTAPTPTTPTGCVDSTLRFKLVWNGRRITRGCDWVANRATAQRCNVSGVAEMCSETCDNCDTCADSSSRFKVIWNDRLITRDCIWVANKATVQRCDLDGVEEACCATCT